MQQRTLCFRCALLFVEHANNVVAVTCAFFGLFFFQMREHQNQADCPASTLMMNVTIVAYVQQGNLIHIMQEKPDSAKGGATATACHLRVQLPASDGGCGRNECTSGFRVAVLPVLTSPVIVAAPRQWLGLSSAAAAAAAAAGLELAPASFTAPPRPSPP